MRRDSGILKRMLVHTNDSEASALHHSFSQARQKVHNLKPLQFTSFTESPNAATPGPRAQHLPVLRWQTSWQGRCWTSTHGAGRPRVGKGMPPRVATSKGTIGPTGRPQQGAAHTVQGPGVQALVFGRSKTSGWVQARSPGNMIILHRRQESTGRVCTGCAGVEAFALWQA